MNKMTGVMIITISIILYAVIYPLTKKANQHIPPFNVMAISMFILFILSFLASIFFEKGFSLSGNNIKNDILVLVLIGVINFIAFWLLILSYKYFEIWQVTLFTLFTPLLSGIFAYFILGEKITVKLFIGLAIMGVGLFVALR